MNRYLAPYDYEIVKNKYIASRETIFPMRNDGSKVYYALPIKHQELRLGKWIPNEYILINAVKLYYDLVQQELTQSFGFTNLKAYTTNTRHCLSKDDNFVSRIDDITSNKLTVKLNYID